MGTFGPRGLALALSLTAAALAQAADENLWPFWTASPPAEDGARSWTAAGPLAFSEPRPDGRVAGLRPLFLRRDRPAEGRTTWFILYPFFSWDRRTAGDVRWSFFSLVNYDRAAPSPAGAAVPQGLDVWPFYFSRQTGDPATSYRALLPLGGTLKNRFGSARIDFALFPLYSRWEKNGRIETDLAWPFVRILSGDGCNGFEFWPLFGFREKAGAWRESYAAWPLYLRRERTVEGGTDRFVSVMPLYSARNAPGLVDRTFAGPFFGYTRRDNPAWTETRYFWPFIVRGRGDGGRLTDRWAPFYTHSVRGPVDKRWIAWPVFRQQRWSDGSLANRKTQILYFVYWRLDQRDPARPGAAPASKSHLWPLYSAWDNGAGRRQLQVLSPFEVFYPHDDNVRTLWSPLFALYRFDRRSPDAVRTSFLFNAVTYRREAARWQVNIGPLVRLRRDAGRTRVTLLPFLFGRKSPGGTSAPVPS